jgi:3'-5' exonuclease
MINTSLEKILFMDIETVGCAPNYTELQKSNPLLAEQFSLYGDQFKRKFVEDVDKSIEQIFEDRAGLTPEFAKIVCISFGFIINGEVRVQSFAGDDEKEILLGVKDIMERVNAKGYTLCGHNVKGFDIPMLEKRLIVNGMSLPSILPSYDTKPWEMKVIDTKEVWACGAWGAIGTLELVCVSLGIESPKNMSVKGNEVHETYWTKKDIDGITKYCEKDVVTVVEIVMKLKDLK